MAIIKKQYRCLKAGTASWKTTWPQARQRFDSLLPFCRLRLYPTGLKNSKINTVTATTVRHITNIITQTAGLYGSVRKKKHKQKRETKKRRTDTKPGKWIQKALRPLYTTAFVLIIRVQRASYNVKADRSINNKTSCSVW